MYDLDVNEILVSIKESYGAKNPLKHFFGHNDDDVIRPLCIKLPQMTGYIKNSDDNNTVRFIVDDNRLLKKYSKIWGKIGNLINIEFDSEPVYGYDDKYIKTKIKLYREKVNTNFQSKKSA